MQWVRPIISITNRWFAPQSRIKALALMLLFAFLLGSFSSLAVVGLVTAQKPKAQTIIPIVIPDDDGIPATLDEAKLWIGQARWTHIVLLLIKPERPQWEKDWDSMWVVRYKKILQRLEFIKED